MIDSPVTPGTPDIPGDITTLAGGQSPQPVWSTVSEPVSFEGCQELARAVKNCSKSLIEGSWTPQLEVGDPCLDLLTLNQPFESICGGNPRQEIK